MEENRGGTKDTKDGEENMVVAPGFRFHPTDEELLGFYLQRKVQRKSIAHELIREVDIYKFDPWDLPKIGGISSRDKEWYFFCMRGRKYRNSVRPNRVTQTGTGFWKATGIDKPVYPSSACSNKCIGLKKSLVYYIGNAGKGKKTEWMMHEYRFPPSNQEAEVWTLCRIFKRETSFSKFTPDTKTTVGNGNLEEARSGDFSNTPEVISVDGSPIASSRSDFWTASNDDGLFGDGNWDELGSVIRFHGVQ